MQQQVRKKLQNAVIARVLEFIVVSAITILLIVLPLRFSLTKNQSSVFGPRRLRYTRVRKLIVVIRYMRTECT